MLAGAFVLVIGLFAVASAWRLSRDARTLRRYVAVPGRVVARDVRGATVASTGSSDGVRFEPHVEYAYEVDGEHHVGQRISLVHTTYTRDAAERALAAIPDEVTVYADPARPGEAVLRRDGVGMAVAVGVFGVLAVLVGVVLIVAA